jgi:hypothetical protein
MVKDGSFPVSAVALRQPFLISFRHRTNEPFDIGPLPGRSRCGKHLFYAHGFYLIDEVLPEDAIPIAQ